MEQPRVNALGERTRETRATEKKVRYTERNNESCRALFFIISVSLLDSTARLNLLGSLNSRNINRIGELGLSSLSEGRSNYDQDYSIDRPEVLNLARLCAERAESGTTESVRE